MRFALIAAGILAVTAPAYGADILYDQDFESPNGFVNDGGDINLTRTVNQLYGGQPAGFFFSQQYTVETLRIGGTEAFGVGYQDPAGIGGQYTLSMQNGAQNDQLGLAFNVGDYQYLNLRMDISSIDLDRFGQPFVPAGGAAPVFLFSLYDNPGGALGLGSGTALDSFEIAGLLNPSKNVFLWSEALGGLDASGSTNGNVILRIDLIAGGYAAFDNLRIVASDIKGDVGAVVPEPATWAMMLLGFGAIGSTLRRRKTRAAHA